MASRLSVRHQGSYYEDSSCPYPAINPLQQDLDVDVAIIGGGVTGLSTALQLSERGLSTVVLEADTFASGASGRSGGQLLLGFNESQQDLERQYGAEDAARFWALSQTALELTRHRIQTHGIDCDLKQGALTLATTPKEQRKLLQYHAALNHQGVESQILKGDTLYSHIQSSRYTLGVHETESGHLHPRNYTLGLAKAALSQGVMLFDHTPVTHIQKGATLTIAAGLHQIRAQHLVLAGNALIGNLLPGLAKGLLPVSSHIIATEPLSVDLIPCQAACSDMAFLLHYFRMSNDGRLLWGGRPGVLGRNDDASAQILHQRMLKHFPQLTDTHIDFSWGGKVAVTQPQMPEIRRLENNITVAQGYSGHGMALAGLAGQVVADSITGSPAAMALFERVTHRRFLASDSARSGIAQLGMLWFRLQEIMAR